MMMTRPILPALAAAALVCLSPDGLAQNVYIDDDFEGHFPPDLFWHTWENADENFDRWEITAEDPDGTPNQSLWMHGHTIHGFLPFGSIVPSDADPVVFRFRMWDPMLEDEEGGLLGGVQHAVLRPAAAANFVSAGMVTWADVGEYDVTRYQVRVMGGGNWIQLAAERTLGWNEFEIVIHNDTVDVYVNGELDPWGTAIPRAAGAGFDRVVLGSTTAGGGDTWVHFDDVYVANDPGAAHVIAIIAHPESQPVAVDGDLSLEVVAEGGSFTYQWQKDGVDLSDGDGISGSTSSVLMVEGVDFEDAGLYRVLVSDGTADRLSAAATIVIEPFLFVAQPESVVIMEGEDAVFSVEVEGTGPFDYQWLKDGEEIADGGHISGTGTDTLTIAGAAEADIGSYSVRVENVHGERTSASAALSVGPAATGVRWDFEQVETVPAPNEAWLFHHPRRSGSTDQFLASSPNDSIVVGDFPEGMWGARTLRVRWAWLPGQTNPWLRLGTSSAVNLRSPIIGFDRFLRFDIHTNQDVYVALGVRETGTTGEYGENGGNSGPIEWIGGDIDPNDPSPAGRPPKARLIEAGQWTAVYFDLANDPVKGFAAGANGILEGDRGTLEQLAFTPVRDAEGNYSTDPFIVYLDNFEVTEVGPSVPVDLPTLSIEMVETGARLQIEGPASAAFTLQASTDLEGWAFLADITTDAGGAAEHIDEEAADFDRRFYRLVP